MHLIEQEKCLMEQGNAENQWKSLALGEIYGAKK